MTCSTGRQVTFRHSGPCSARLNAGEPAPELAVSHSQPRPESSCAGDWTHIPSALQCLQDSSFACCNGSSAAGWQWAPTAVACRAHRLAGSDVEALLHGKWLAMAGDSVTRNLFAALLRLTTGRAQVYLEHLCNARTVLIK